MVIIRVIVLEMARKIYRIAIFPFRKIIITLRKTVLFEMGSYADSRTVLEGYNTLGFKSFISNSYIGFGSYVAEFSKIYNTKIGKYTSIGQNVTTATGKHPINENVSTCPSFFSAQPRNHLKLCKSSIYEEKENFNDGYSIHIGSDVWIGNNAVILHGVTIGDGAIIGAGAVVTKDVKPYSVNVGNPAKILKMRYDDETIECLLSIKWYEKDLEWIKLHSKEFGDVKTFIDSNLQK